MIALSPAIELTKMNAAPVVASLMATCAMSIPSPVQRLRAISPKESALMRVISRTRAPDRAAKTAWLKPLPLGPRWKPSPSNVTPIWGSRAARKARSAAKMPR